jgi:hypothetical protein
MSRLPLVLLGAGVAVILLGCGVVVYTVTDYLDSPLAISSTAGLEVFRAADGSLVSYDFFEVGIGPNIIATGVLLVFAALFLLAVRWRGKRVSGPGWRARIRSLIRRSRQAAPR